MSLLILLAGFLLAGPLDEEAPEEAEKPPRREEIVVVTATGREEPLLRSISLVSVISSEDLFSSPALVLDDHLRRVPGFSLFRRSGSLTAHPTTQGVSLRGIGPSGTSRSLVLFDGIPFNDPFGGWVYWNRLPVSSLESVEVVRGGTSQLYGSSAMGGTIQLIPRRPVPGRFELRGQLGSRGTYDLDFFGSEESGPWAFTLAGRVFDTDGFHLVDEEVRGAVDTPARVGFQTFFGRVHYRNLHVGLNLFREERNNGTLLQENRSRIGMLEVGLTDPRWRLHFYTQSTRFESSFSRILPDRSQEFLTAEQDIPTVGVGSSVSWMPAGNWVLGADWRHSGWEDNRQNLFGVFLQDLVPVHRQVDLLWGARFDVWENQDVQTGFNPRLGLVYRLHPNLTARSSLYRGFRAPTLNELYRPFRVGNIVTEANPELDEENLWGGEAGVDFHPSPDFLLRLNVFVNSFRNSVGNVTLSVSPELIERQRRNLGPVRVRGLELESGVRLSAFWRLRLAYLYSFTEVVESGLRLPQVPLHQGVLGVQFRGPVQVNVDTRWVGSQFEDDLNSLDMGGFPLLDVALRRPLSESLDLILSVENLLDRRYVVGRTPVESLGAPRLFHGGIHLRLGR